MTVPICVLPLPFGPTRMSNVGGLESLVARFLLMLSRMSTTIGREPSPGGLLRSRQGVAIPT
jgi:hypothetical protein